MASPHPVDRHARLDQSIPLTCSKQSIYPSTRLQALCDSRPGRATTQAEIERVIEVLPGIIEKLRSLSLVVLTTGA